MHEKVLGRTTSALAACNDDDCARAALVGTPFAEAFAVTLPWFLAKAWAEHATQASSGIEVARATTSAEVGLRERSELAQDPSADRGKWAALVVHAVAAVVTAWEPAHESVLQGPAETAMPEAMAWLAREWPSRLHGESAATFAKRYAAAPIAP